ncbi:hypothetical protein ACFTY7_11140 [Streptomyces sp. NPDC057062]|uniref:hypothetical protein n=1 Tax=Streptomyces sp. NPDC057062 TaxID=3346011 RepID=UPI00363D5331
MARKPSAEELLQAVGEHVARHGISVLLTSPGAAHLSWQSLLDCRIVRSVEERSEREMRTTGRRRDIADRPAYTDLASHPVETPADPVTPLRLELVREGSLGEVACEGCEGGPQDLRALYGQRPPHLREVRVVRRMRRRHRRMLGM